MQCDHAIQGRSTKQCLLYGLVKSTLLQKYRLPYSAKPAAAALHSYSPKLPAVDVTDELEQYYILGKDQQPSAALRRHCPNTVYTLGDFTFWISLSLSLFAQPKD